MTSPYSDPTGTDNSADWFLMDPSGDLDITITGDVGYSYSTYRFQPLSTGTVTNDYRFQPDEEIRAFMYTYQHDVDTLGDGTVIEDVITFTEVTDPSTSTYITLEGAFDSLRRSVVTVGLSVAAIATMYSF